MEDLVSNTEIIDPILTKNKVRLFLKREDQLHPQISGNKFRKLKYNLTEAKYQQKNTLLTFGGAYSNHILATAAAGKKYSFNTIGIIRGEELALNLNKTLSENQTLSFAKELGMQLYFISRSDYTQKTTSEYIEALHTKFGDFYLLPEGGTNDLAIKGCEEILTPQDHVFDTICCAVGTGGTLSGIINSASTHQKVIGFPVLKENYLHTEILKATTNTNWELNRNHHLGGYAKITTELIDFINSFSKNQKIALDPIYTGKLLQGIFEEVKSGNFRKNSRILAIHTGGLQGIYGINTKLKKNNQKLINTNYEF